MISLMMEAVRTSETSVNLKVTYTALHPEDSKLYTRRRENLKSHKTKAFHAEVVEIYRVIHNSLIHYKKNGTLERREGW
jgi:hypothetical protein